MTLVQFYRTRVLLTALALTALFAVNWAASGRGIQQTAAGGGSPLLRRAKVTDYGAIPDGTFDSTEAFAKAAGELAPGACLEVPAGQGAYMLRDSVKLHMSACLIGTGAIMPSIRQIDAKQPVIELVPDAKGATYRIENLTLLGGDVGVKLVGGDEKYISRFSSLVDLSVSEQTTACLQSDGVGWIGARFIDNVNCETTGDYGLYAVTKSSGQASSTFTNLRVSGSRRAAIALINQSPQALNSNIGCDACIVEYNNGRGLWLKGSRMTLTRVHFEHNGSSTGDADIVMESQGGNGSAAILYGGVFSTPSENQNHKRVFFDSGPEDLFMAHVQMSSVDRIDGNNKTGGSRISIVDASGQLPIVTNFEGGALGNR